MGARPWVPLGVATFAVSVSVVLGVRPVSDPSPWIHLKIGAFLLDGGRFGLPDPWAVFATRAYLPTEWLPAILGQQVYSTAGLPGIAWMRCAGILGLLSALVWCARRSADTVTAVLVSLAALVGAYDGLTERPQLIGFVFLAVAIGAALAAYASFVLVERPLMRRYKKRLERVHLTQQPEVSPPAPARDQALVTSSGPTTRPPAAPPSPRP